MKSHFKGRPPGVHANAVGIVYGETEELRTLAEVTSIGSSLQLGSIDIDMGDYSSVSDDLGVSSDKENIPPPPVELPCTQREDRWEYQPFGDHRARRAIDILSRD